MSNHTAPQTQAVEANNTEPSNAAAQAIFTALGNPGFITNSCKNMVLEKHEVAAIILRHCPSSVVPSSLTYRFAMTQRVKVKDSDFRGSVVKREERDGIYWYHVEDEDGFHFWFEEGKIEAV